MCTGDRKTLNHSVPAIAPLAHVCSQKQTSVSPILNCGQFFWTPAKFRGWYYLLLSTEWILKSGWKWVWSGGTLSVQAFFVRRGLMVFFSHCFCFSYPVIISVGSQLPSSCELTFSSLCSSVLPDLHWGKLSCAGSLSLFMFVETEHIQCACQRARRKHS